MMPSEVANVATTITIPQFLRDMITAAAGKSARSVSGEIVYRLAQSFGVMPDGSAVETANSAED